MYFSHPAPSVEAALDEPIARRPPQSAVRRVAALAYLLVWSLREQLRTRCGTSISMGSR